MAQPPLGPPAFARRDLARFDRALGQQPGDDVHDPRRDLQRFAGEADAGERLERPALVAAGVVEIGPRLVGEQHRLGVKRVDQPRRDPRLRLRHVRFVHHRHRCHCSSPLKTLEIAGRLRRSARSVPDRDSGRHAQAMMSGMLRSTIRWIWSLSLSLRLFSRASSSWSPVGSDDSSRDLLVEPAMLGLQALRACSRGSSSFIAAPV